MPLGGGDEDGVVEPGEPADQRRLSHFGLGDERRAARPGEEQYVEPAHMIGEEKDVAPERSPDDRHPHPRRAPNPAQEPPRPGRARPEQSPEIMERNAED